MSVFVVLVLLPLVALLQIPFYYAFRDSAFSKPWWQAAWERNPRRLLLALLVIPLVWCATAGIVFVIIHA